MKSPASFSRGAGWPQRPSKLAYPATHSTSEFDHLTRFVGLSTRSPTAITGTLCGVDLTDISQPQSSGAEACILWVDSILPAISGLLRLK